MPPPLDLLPSLLKGLVVTAEIMLGAAVVGLLAGFLGGLGRLSANRFVRGISRLYIDIFRGTSALVQLFWVRRQIGALFQQMRSEAVAQ